MRLERLILENVRQYQGRHVIEFAPPGKRNVTLILGLNGAGKTHLLEALRWCLYGLPTGDDPRDLVSKGALASAQAKEQFFTEVETFFDHDGKSYSARRRLRVTTGERAEEGRPTFAIVDEGLSLMILAPDGNAREVPAPIEEMKGILAADAAEYFFFDGEKIDTFARPDNAVGIAEAVKRVLKFVDLDRAIDHLSDVRREYEKTLKTLAPGSEYGDLVDRREELGLELDEAQERVAATEATLHQVRARKAAIDAALLDMKASMQLIQKRQSFEGDLTAFDERRASALDALAGSMSSAQLLLAHAAISETGAMAEAKRARGEIPSRVRDVVTQDLLDLGRCICGRELAPGTAPRTTIEELHARAHPSEFDEKVIGLALTLPGLGRRGGDVSTTLRSRLADLHAATKGAAATQEKIAEIKGQLSGVRQEDVAELVARGREVDAEAQAAALEQGRGRLRIENLEREISQVEQDLKRQEGLSAKAEKVRRRADLARDAERALIATRVAFVQAVRDQLESGTSDMFQRLVWKKSHFDKVEISEDFGLSVLDKWGAPALGDLSAGETEVLSLAFIVTMGKVAAETVDAKAPVVIDSPFGRLSAEPRENIARSMPALVEQLVLLVTDTELHSTESALEPHIGARYELAFDAGASSTTIVADMS